MKVAGATSHAVRHVEVIHGGVFVLSLERKGLEFAPGDCVALHTDGGRNKALRFVAKKRAKFFGEHTAGASGRKITYTLPSGHFKVLYVVKPYKGYLDRYIEGRGLEPDIPVVQTAADLADKRDTVLEVAREYLMAL